MRTPKVLLLGLALSVLAGCGATGAGDNGPPRAGAAPATSAASAAPSPAAKAPAPPAAVPTKAKPATKAKPVRKKRAKTTAGGPAGSLTRTGRPGVALTFDDGPDPVQTPRLLDLLKRERVKATFCVVGRNVAAYPGLVRRIAAEGHTLCNHTWNHSLTLGKKKRSVIRADLRRTNDAIRRAVPKARIKYMRAPGGYFTPAFVSVAGKLGMKSIYWQVDPRDWEHKRGESGAAHEKKVVRTVQKHVGSGAIVLSHDYRQPGTIAAYRKLIPWLRARYRLIALP
ncbi:polysaccharide deacetylase [Actinoplanes sp. ATCC 53533]|uniref:polysaccharide deacetylase family protein n=1 Tax=Actinoplanes sp. ATCC 53533 TaxID=1288362 RepID=UPI000F799FDF|nr:polysaccharide deacetylase family protein [Actinoplanes sp. ATCC 53533]RSM49866.1 polysaccharide deacetylase [Actinoplanes sp. ATCC 53533]